MASVLERLGPGSRVAVIRLRSLGDCVLTTPAIHLLKRFRPDLRIALVVESRFRELFDDNSDFDAILAPEVAGLRRWRPDLCLNLHGGTRSAWLTAASGAKFRAGFGHFRHGFAYNLRIPRAQEILGIERKVHTAEHLASAVFFLGVPRGEVPRARLFCGQSGWSRSGAPRPSVETGLDAADTSVCATIHASANGVEKTWRAEGFLAVAESLRDSGIEPVFIGAAGDDLTPFSQFRVLQGASLTEIKCLLRRSVLFVGNDSGPAHMAAAFGVPAVVIFQASDPAIWGPWRTQSEVLASPEPADVIAALSRLRVHA